MALTLEFGDFELDEARFELRREGRPVVVQPKVLELILHLARHRDRVVSKNEIFETVWDGTTVSEASLSQAVRSARKVLGDSSQVQSVIRTVRGRGLQFVAEAPARNPRKHPHVERRTEGDVSATGMETHDERRGATSSALYLVAAIHGEAPRAGGARWSLQDLDEVRLGRGSRRRSRRHEGLTRLLSITLPERRASREHARLTRTPDGWMVIDDGSRNGTFVNGERVSKRILAAGDRLACGATTLWLAETAHPLEDDVDVRRDGGGTLSTVLPHLRRLDNELMRVASSDLPVLLIGESGTGKTYLAERIHLASDRTSQSTIDVATIGAADADQLRILADQTAGGTLVLEGLDRLDEGLAATLAHVLEVARNVRVVATSQRPFAELEQRLPRDVVSRVAGYRAELPPLRERLADLGTLLSVLAPDPPRMGEEVIDAFCRYRWPGNLRELGMVLRAAAVVADDGLVAMKHLPVEIRDAGSSNDGAAD
jgi:DNA-binding winged helix-turn-helix (wHTH) protein